MIHDDLIQAGITLTPEQRKARRTPESNAQRAARRATPEAIAKRSMPEAGARRTRKLHALTFCQAIPQDDDRTIWRFSFASARVAASRNPNSIWLDMTPDDDDTTGDG